MAEEILERVVRMVIEDVDRIVFEDEVSDVTMQMVLRAKPHLLL